MTRTTLGGTVTIDGRKVYFDDIFADDGVFQFSGLGLLVLPGDDLFQGVMVEGDGQIRALGPMTIDDGLTLGGATSFVNVGALTQNGGVFALDPSVDDSVAVRNLPGATWTLAGGAGLTHAGAAQFVNLGLLQQTGASETNVVAVDFYGRGTVSAEGTLRFTGDVTRLFGNVEGTGVIVADDAGADRSGCLGRHFSGPKHPRSHGVDD